MNLSARLASLKPLAAFAIAFAWFAASAGWRPLALPDEGRYVGVAWEMLRSGNWAVPTLDGLPFFHKPPLFYWITAAAMAVLGPNEWAARLAPLLGASAGAVGLFLFVRRWVDGATAGLALVVLSTIPMFFVGAQFANHDMLVAGCVSSAVLLAAHALLGAERGQPHRQALAGAFAAAALGVLAKGLIGAVLPALVIVTWALASGRPRAIRRLFWWPGWLVFLGLAGPWFVSMQMRYPGFFDYFVVEQHVRRFAQRGFNNPQPFWFYVPVLLVLSLPWSLWLYRVIRRGHFSDAGRREVRVLMAVWLLAVLVFFSIPGSKLVGYVLPAVPPLAFLLADSLRRVAGADAQEPAWSKPMLWVSVALCATALAAVGLHAREGARPLRSALQGRIQPADQTLMLANYVYDAAFYLKLREPAMVAGDWTAGQAKQRDNWRKELFESGEFDPTLAGRLLVDAQHLAPILCRPTATWIFGDANSAARFAWLRQAEQVPSRSGVQVWRFAGSASGDPACLERPMNGSSDSS